VAYYYFYPATVCKELPISQTLWLDHWDLIDCSDAGGYEIYFGGNFPQPIPLLPVDAGSYGNEWDLNI